MLFNALPTTPTVVLRMCTKIRDWVLKLSFLMITHIWLYRHPTVQPGIVTIPLETCPLPGEQSTTFVTMGGIYLGVTISSFRRC